MARKTFVSSKKNAPTSAASSKEAALRTRQNGEADADAPREANGEDSFEREGANSPLSSAESSGNSSDEGDDGLDDDEDMEGAERDAVAVEVMPSSVGRGKQLRFPMGISRGKESRILHSGSDYGTSDSESAMGMESGGEEDEDHRAGARRGENHRPVEARSDAPDAMVVVDDTSNGEVAYSVKAVRARKRHRPDSDHFDDYFRQMATHVRDCLLSVRDGAGAADVFREEAHREFRRKLEEGTVSRVTWREASLVSPSQEMDTQNSDDAVKTEKRMSDDASRPEKRISDEARPEKRSKERIKKEQSAKEPESVQEQSKPEERKLEETKPEESKPEESKLEERKQEETKKERTKKDRSKQEQSTKDKQSGKHRHKSSRERRDTDPEKSSKSSKKAKSEKHRSDKDRSHKHGESGKQQSRDDIPEATSTQPKNGPESANDVESMAKSVPTRSNGAQDKVKTEEDSDQLCAACKKKLTGTTEESPPAPSIPPIHNIVPVGTFTLPRGSIKDVKVLRDQASKLHDEARKLKHAGDRNGSSGSGSGSGSVDQAKQYLRSSAKFFQHALVLADVKAAYKELNDMQHARSFGDACIETLRQTSSLVESTIRTFQAAGNTRLVGLAHKMAAIVHLTIYRLQHLKLTTLYADLTPAGRSPDSRQNGTTPPIIASGSESQETAIRAHLIKEMKHMLRGFEMWRRYEASQVDVLSRITNPIVTDLSILFEDLPGELNAS